MLYQYYYVNANEIQSEKRFRDCKQTKYTEQHVLHLLSTYVITA